MSMFREDMVRSMTEWFITPGPILMASSVFHTKRSSSSMSHSQKVWFLERVTLGFHILL